MSEEVRRLLFANCCCQLIHHWSAVNAVTQIETSTRGTTAAKGRAQFARGTFGAGAQISKRAFAVAAELVGA